ncbi:MAG: decarboxylating 6-phosphogluconate dehydrogenase [Propionibacteriaceae bacterium]|nr:decarboxylating 6-phosphogluconate dehydrogenase [Propionibacteriaceae bacterium]
MTIGMIGLGKMGGQMAQRLRAAGHTVVGYDVAADSGRTVETLSEMVDALPVPRVVWVMVPAGAPTDAVIAQLGDLLDPGDLVIDGGNSHYKDAVPHAQLLATGGVHFVDVGTSGGVWGGRNGYALMVGGDATDVATIAPVLGALKPDGDDGLVHAGPVGAGHFAKMIHNGIEYGMMQAMGEGYALLKAANVIDDPDAVIASWRSGSVVRSWLLDLLANAVQDNPGLDDYAPQANESGEARWTVAAALDLGVPVPVTATALYARQASCGGQDDALRVVAALRNQFGGHAAARGSSD